MDNSGAMDDSEPIIVCIHCQRLLSVREVHRHLAMYRQQLRRQFREAPVVEPEAPAVEPEDLGANVDMELDNPDGEGELNWGAGGGNQHELGHSADEQGPEFDIELIMDNRDGRPPMPNSVNVPLGNMDGNPPPDIGNGLQQNPPVAINDWPDPDPDIPDLEEDEPSDELDNDLDGDPEFVERDVPLGFDPLDEPGLTNEELRQLLELHLGDLANDALTDINSRRLTEKDRNTILLLATRLRAHFSRQTWDDLRAGVCKPLEIPSEFVSWCRLNRLAELDSRAYDCCINSCCCFLGKYKDDATCQFCKEPRFNARGKPRRQFRYTPLIPQLQSLFKNRDMASRVRYRARVDEEYEPGVVQDVFDSENYRSLLRTQLRPDNEYRMFSHPEDLALGISTDGFTLFKRRRRGLSTAWPIILINYNLHPSVRTRLENVLCVGVIPGPKQCKDLNSFLIPLLEELLMLEDGVQTSGVTPEGEAYWFVLRAFIILGFGDIPAIAKLLLIKGHNALTPCRACYIQGILCQWARNAIYYVPLTDPHTGTSIPFELIPVRTHARTLAHLQQLDRAPNKTERERIAKDVGIIGRSIFAHLKSIDLAASFPYDIMHLLFENLVPNMIRHWTGEFKGLDQGTGTYQLSQPDWATIGRLTAQATRTIPSAFVGTLPNIATDRKLYKAEASAFWIQYIAPILLANRLPRVYYDHFLLVREVILRCVQIKITHAEIDELQDMVNKWVADYELLYYQHEATRLPTCPLTIHALLHIPFYIRRTGPLWASWAFVMERFCGHLLPAVKNRVRPYEHLDNYVQRRAQLQIVSNVHNLPSLAKPRIDYRVEQGEEITSVEAIYEEFPLIVLGGPVIGNIRLENPLLRELTRYFSQFYELRQAELVARIDANSIISYGRFRLAGDGDRFRTAALIDRDTIARDNSFVKPASHPQYDLLPDANANYRNRPDVPVREAQYGRLMGIYHVLFANDDGVPERFLLARITQCHTGGRDAAAPENPVVSFDAARMSRTTPDIVHMSTIVAVVGRVSLGGNRWAIVDRSRSNTRPEFLDDAGNVEFE